MNVLFNRYGFGKASAESASDTASIHNRIKASGFAVLRESIPITRVDAALQSLLPLAQLKRNNPFDQIFNKESDFEHNGRNAGPAQRLQMHLFAGAKRNGRRRKTLGTSVDVRQDLGSTVRHAVEALRNVLQMNASLVDSECKVQSLVALYSKANCGMQPPHRDFPLTNPDGTKLFSDDNFSMGAVVALEHNTTFVLWPQTHKHATEGKPFLYDNERYPDTVSYRDAVVVSLQQGDILFFHGNLIHAGSAYTRPNLRMHFYFDSPIYARPQSPQAKGNTQQDTAIVLARDAAPEFAQLVHSTDTDVSHQFPLCNGAFNQLPQCEELPDALSNVDSDSLSSAIALLPSIEIVPTGTKFDCRTSKHVLHHCSIVQRKERYTVWTALYGGCEAVMLTPYLPTKIEDMSNREQRNPPGGRYNRLEVNRYLEENRDQLTTSLHVSFLRSCGSTGSRLIGVMQNEQYGLVACMYK